MAEELDVQLILTCQLRPALLLDANGVVIAANNGSRRMIAHTQSSAPQDMHNPLIGQDLSQLGLVLQPRQTPILSSWSELLDAAVHAPRLDEPRYTTANSFHPDTDNFWDEESVCQAIVESDVEIPRRSDEQVAENEDDASTIKARAAVHWFPRREGGSFLVIFDRSSASKETVSDQFDSVNNPPGSSNTPSDAHPEEPQLNSKPMMPLDNQSLSSNEKIYVEKNTMNRTCSTSTLIEMRSPINGIIGMSTCLLEGFLSEEQRKYAKGIFETSRSLLTSVHDTLGISKRRSGYMDVESTPFSAPLPERKQHTAAVRSSSSTAKHVAHQPTVSWLSAPLPESRVHILLVEDNRVNRIVMTKLADKFGYQISSVENGQEALDYLCRSSRQPRPRAVLMDCSLAPIDGYETTRRIRQDRSMFDEETRSLPIIGLTVGARESDVEKCWSAGMDDRLSKPIGSKVYQKTLAKWTIAKRSHKLGHLMDAKL